MISFYLDLANKVPVLVLLFLSAAAVIGGDYLAKFWSLNHKSLFLIFSFISYFLTPVFYIPTLLRKGLVWTSIIWDLVTLIGFLIIGWFIFKEPTTSAQIVGVFLGVISLIILITTG